MRLPRVITFFALRLSCLVIVFPIPITELGIRSAYSMDFAPQEDDGLDVIGDSSEAGFPATSVMDIDTEQAEIRVTRRRALGLGFGEETPHESLGLRFFNTFSEVGAYLVSLGSGESRFTEQNEGEPWFESKGKVFSVGVKYFRWPSKHFPFVLTAGVAGEMVLGKVTTQTGSSGDYQTAVAYGICGLTLNHIFEAGVWLQWNLISLNYGKSLAGRYENMTGSQMRSVRNNLEGLKITGLANLTIGYAF